VGYGILFALRIALSRRLDRRTAERIHALIIRLGLPPLPQLDPEVLLAAMARDKKALESGLVWVLPRTLGQGWMAGDVPVEEIRTTLRAFLSAPLGLPA
jgi:3-dehydroquinate synthase